jgi:hypothetical protein
MSASRGRHRVGLPGLRYCRDIPEVRERLESAARRTDDRRLRPSRILGAAAATGAVVVSGWLASNSPALANIIGK